MSREYPDHPRVGVGAVVFHQGRLLLVRRGGHPGVGKWSLPGGLVDLGETTADAVRRELAEECNLEIRVVDVAGVVDRVIRDAAGRVRYHYVLVDFLAFADTDRMTAGSDAAEARWVTLEELPHLDLTEGLVEMVRRALALAAGAGG